MKIKSLLNILGALLVILGLTMILPMLISFGSGDINDFKAFLFSSLICIFMGLPCWFFTRNNKTITNKDGFAIVTFSWIITAIIGALPFYLSGSIPNITDAFFESMSGVTTTGASILGNTETMPHLINGIERHWKKEV